MLGFGYMLTVHGVRTHYLLQRQISYLIIGRFRIEGVGG